jgi:hypothetical protein
MRRFLSRDEGTVSVEAVLIFPILLWAFAATFVFFEALNLSTNTQKAAYTVADLLSRRATEPVSAAYVEGMATLYQNLTGSRRQTGIRVSSVAWDPSSAGYVVLWSAVGGSLGGNEPAVSNDGTAVPIASSGMAGLESRMPEAPMGETLIVVEAMVDYRPAMLVGIDPRILSKIVVTRPRFAPQLVFENSIGVIGMPPTAVTCDDGPLCV